ncbi:NAD(P)/FAD-dependent oxidoreductase [Aureibaculum sp. 2210JD6-5]|uniref:NAD(P)/FAD-dependent oxidoreductase n=1 Tax=Aureibaculum sp. 2210JD6-5 TaxID=3103957 RepID=UPI002AAE3A5C|nr:NAD(P)/FAD-dependent oxidoreductase [Aureibaculum sp. 2210JD6-5]MDY7395771.1 NAD(P)/FAD-dependent oxidoreductase [Aureibaculum sp. 2210JD6-5]
MFQKKEVIIIGGGLAGLISALHLSKQGVEVLVIEKNDYPKHKVCGEYISNEVLPYLKYLGINPLDSGAKKITNFAISTIKSKLLETKLPLGGFGISRYTLDHLLAKKAVENGARVIHDVVVDVLFQHDEFTVFTKNEKKFSSKMVIGAYGKRSNIDVQLNRKFIKNESPYLAVKTHVTGNFPEDLVALHNFKGGYCGVSKVENGSINLCYITNYKAFKKYNNIDDFQQNVLYKNTYLKDIFENSKAVFEKPLTIGQVSFSSKKPIENHMLMCGDTAGMIHPLCGNGMSMAIHSAKIASELILDFFDNNISRIQMEKKYEKQWNNEFKSRLKAGHIIARLFNINSISELMLFGLQRFPGMLPKIIKKTHGKPLTAS